MLQYFFVDVISGSKKCSSTNNVCVKNPFFNTKFVFKYFLSWNENFFATNYVFVDFFLFSSNIEMIFLDRRFGQKRVRCTWSLRSNRSSFKFTTYSFKLSFKCFAGWDKKGSTARDLLQTLAISGPQQPSWAQVHFKSCHEQINE